MDAHCSTFLANNKGKNSCSVKTKKYFEGLMNEIECNNM